MDKSQAIHDFWSGFGLIAYDENSVPDDAVMPYITYSMESGAIDEVLSLTGSLWYRNPSWIEISKKSDQIASAIGYDGIIKKIDGGYAYIYRRVPFAQRMGDPEDSLIKRIYINIAVEFFTAT